MVNQQHKQYFPVALAPNEAKPNNFNFHQNRQKASTSSRIWRKKLLITVLFLYCWLLRYFHPNQSRIERKEK